MAAAVPPKLRPLLVALLTGALSSLPALYLRLVWPTVPGLVATHSSGGVADHFAGRHELWSVIWWPALAFVVFTFWPQVRAGQSLFWSGPRQRQVRAVVVAAVTAGVQHSINLGKNAGPADVATSRSSR